MTNAHPRRPGARKTATGYAPVLFHTIGFMRERSETLGSERFVDHAGVVQYGNRPLRSEDRADAVAYARRVIELEEQEASA